MYPAPRHCFPLPHHVPSTLPEWERLRSPEWATSTPLKGFVLCFHSISRRDLFSSSMTSHSFSQQKLKTEPFQKLRKWNPSKCFFLKSNWRSWERSDGYAVMVYKCIWRDKTKLVPDLEAKSIRKLHMSTLFGSISSHSSNLVFRAYITGS